LCAGERIAVFGVCCGGRLLCREREEGDGGYR
jgi:hypothetical protein